MPLCTVSGRGIRSSPSVPRLLPAPAMSHLRHIGGSTLHEELMQLPPVVAELLGPHLLVWEGGTRPERESGSKVRAGSADASVCALLRPCSTRLCARG